MPNCIEHINMNNQEELFKLDTTEPIKDVAALPKGITDNLEPFQSTEILANVYLDSASFKGQTPEDIYKAFTQGNIYIDSTPKKAWIAIDPGKTGGIAIITEKSQIYKWEMPLSGDDIDVIALSDLLTNLVSNYNAVLIVEDVHSIFGVSASNNFTFGYVCGQIDAVVKLLKVKRYDIQPKSWQKVIWSSVDMVYKPKKPEQKKPSVDTKATSIMAAKRLFPNEDLRGNIVIKYYGDNANNRKLNRVGQPIPSTKESEHDGIVDALLIAEAARRLNY